MRLEFLVRHEGAEVRLCAPEVGTFSRALGEGALIAAGTPAGVLHSLGRCYELVVPTGVTGRVAGARPARAFEPVGYGTVLYALEALENVARVEADEQREETGSALVFRAPYSGRFWHRAAPGEAPFLQVGALLTDGQTFGLIEVMKTFTHLAYRTEGELPARARLVRFLVPDGGEAREGEALLELARE